MTAKDPVGEDQDCPLLGVEVTVVTRRTLDLQEDVAAQIFAALVQVAPQTTDRRKRADARSPDPGDFARPLTGWAGVGPLDPTMAGRTLWLCRSGFQTGEAAMGD
jgi:hypothetical protein